VVGRAKTERRPLLKVSAEIDGGAVNAIVQNDWHVRVFDGDGKVRSVTEIRGGDRVLVALRSGGRHVGHAVDEHLWEA
jgi:3-amino-4-hydroxybenzoic acid synthase